MNDDEMFADLGHFTGAIPVEAVMRQGRAIRRRRRVFGGGTLAAAAALAIVAPVALVGGNGPDVEAASGARIVVNRPVLESTGDILLSGTYNDEPWSQTVGKGCVYGKLGRDADCLELTTGLAPTKTPVDLVMDDVKEPGSGHYFYALQYSPDTEFTVVTLGTGDEVMVPGIDVSGQRIAWLPAPGQTPITKIVAYRKDGTEIGHTPYWGTDASDYDVMGDWYRPDGTTLASVPDVPVAKGTAGGVDWSITSVIGATGRCFVYRIGSVPTTVCPKIGAWVYRDNRSEPGAKDGVVLGELAPETSRVDVAFKDGTVQHLTPVRSGHVFVGAYLPDITTVVSVTPR